MEKRYQVFVSSTYADLQDERRKVIQTLMEMDCIPAGMELFPAADEEQWAFIKRVIDDCDYYLLIVGGRYGSTTPEGISYTEKEYDYAIERGIKVIALLHEDPEQVPDGKNEKDPESKARLQQFREKVETNRLVKHWRNPEDLPGLVAVSLSKTMKLYPAVGWIKADKASNEDLLIQINELRQENNQLRIELAKSADKNKVNLADIAGLDDKIALHGKFYSETSRAYRPWTFETTWGDLFALIAPSLLKLPNEDLVHLTMAQYVYNKTEWGGKSPSLDEHDFETIKLQFTALGLVDVQYLKTVAGGMGFFWTLTQQGQAQMLRMRVVRKDSGVSKSEQP
jgi:hypothetical protein